MGCGNLLFRTLSVLPQNQTTCRKPTLNAAFSEAAASAIKLATSLGFASIATWLVASVKVMALRKSTPSKQRLKKDGRGSTQGLSRDKPSRMGEHRIPCQGR